MDFWMGKGLAAFNGTFAGLHFQGLINKLDRGRDIGGIDEMVEEFDQGFFSLIEVWEEIRVSGDIEGGFSEGVDFESKFRDLRGIGMDNILVGRWDFEDSGLEEDLRRDRLLGLQFFFNFFILEAFMESMLIEEEECLGFRDEDIGIEDSS